MIHRVTMRDIGSALTYRLRYFTNITQSCLQYYPQGLCDTINKEYERDVSHEVEFYEILLEAYLMLRSMHARKGISRNSASTISTGSTSQECEWNELGIAEGILLSFERNKKKNNKYTLKFYNNLFLTELQSVMKNQYMPLKMPYSVVTIPHFPNSFCKKKILNFRFTD